MINDKLTYCTLSFYDIGDLNSLSLFKDIIIDRQNQEVHVPLGIEDNDHYIAMIVSNWRKRTSTELDYKDIRFDVKNKKIILKLDDGWEAEKEI